jgi:Arc/MetJ-type ribon-helix-helix transcriptional regulator
MTRRYGRPGGWQQADLPPADDVPSWLAGRLPDGLFDGPPEVTIDRDEILIVGTIPAPDLPPDTDPASRATAESGRIARFREDSREARVGVAQQAERRYQRKVSWGVRCGGSDELFSTLAAPVMTRLRQPQRQVLDTLVGSGVARSRSEALAWCVRLVGEHAEAWLSELRQAMEQVDDLRARGPQL